MRRSCIETTELGPAPSPEAERICIDLDAIVGSVLTSLRATTGAHVGMTFVRTPGVPSIAGHCGQLRRSIHQIARAATTTAPRHASLVMQLASDDGAACLDIRLTSFGPDAPRLAALLNGEQDFLERFERMVEFHDGAVSAHAIDHGWCIRARFPPF